MKSEILVIAEAILANTQILKLLLDKLPDAVKSEVAAKVEEATPVTPVPVAEVKKPVEVVIPTLLPPKVETPVIAVPVPVAVAPVVTAVVTPTTSSSDCPIKDGKSLLDTMMSIYKSMGPEKGAQIQTVLNSLGCQAVNEVRPDQYQALWDGLVLLKNS